MKRLGVWLLLVGLLLSGCGQTPTTGPALYARHCGACHGGDLAGNVGPALGAGSEAAAESDASYRAAVREGVGDMPATARLSDEQLDKIIAYLREAQG
ncbi:MAG: cytochrome c [Acidimicrobiia bacterium]|nr:cytochrome c [Acidimicrobiia bacterium]MBT8194430.1 cytochrome c [Acidimicrobiia bacterium]NNF89408.1 cytochrome c [Acidimicrobiia bacterium]NNJ47517.1 cytochrome c [Acidimicrobiia bacterium]NNL13008.1 cytochrome c [Acidimicrobiia bacterium]